MNNDITFCCWKNCPRKECNRHLDNAIDYSPFINQADLRYDSCPKCFKWDNN